MFDLHSLSSASRGLTIAEEGRCANRPARIADRRGRVRSPDAFAEWCAWKRWLARARPRRSTTCSRPSSEPTRSSHWSADNLARRDRVHGTETTTHLQRTPNHTEKERENERHSAVHRRS